MLLATVVACALVILHICICKIVELVHVNVRYEIDIK